MSTGFTSSPSPTTTAPACAPPRRHRLVTALVVGALLALGCIASVASAPTASAHDELTGTAPADASTVATAPDSVVLHFTEPPLTIGLAVKVTGPAGDVQQGAARVDGNDVVQALLPAAPAGAYRVAWRVTADDGHASSGELTFTATADNARVATATPEAGAPTTASTSSAPSTRASTSPAAETATPATTSSGTSPVAIAVIAVVLAVLAALTLVLTRRSRGSRNGS